MESREDPSSPPIEALGLSIHWYHSLKRNGVHTVGQLAVLPERHLMALRHSPEGTMDELKYKVALLLPAEERARWVEEWKGELCALRSRKARVRFTMSLLLEGARELAVTLRHAQLGHKSAGR
jgi:hypothetical protein